MGTQSARSYGALSTEAPLELSPRYARVALAGAHGPGATPRAALVSLSFLTPPLPGTLYS